MNEPKLPQTSDLITLVTLTVKMPGSIKVHKEASEELRAQKGVKKKSRAKVTVDILASDDLDDANKVKQLARNFLYKKSLAYDERNVRAVPNVLLDDVLKGLDEYGRTVDVHFHTFLQSHPFLKERFENAAALLASGIEFPSVEELESKYMWNVDHDVPPDVSKLENISLAGVPSSVEADFRERVKASHGRKIARAQGDVTKRVMTVLTEVVDHMDKFGRDAEGKLVGGFKDSLIGNVRELTGNLRAFNITNDPELEEVRKLLVSKVCKIDPGTLRESEPLRKALKQDAKSILARAGRLGKSD